MKAYISLLLALSFMFLCSCENENKENKGTKVEVSSAAASTVSTVSYLDLETSELLKDYRYKDSIYFEATVNTVQYTAAKSGDKKYVRYVTDTETSVYIFDGTDFYLLDEAEKTAEKVTGIPASYLSLLLAFDEDQLNRFYKTGTETIDGTEYLFETFNTDRGYNKFILDSENKPIHLYNWYTTDNVIKVDFALIDTQPDESLFSLPEEYQIISE